MVMERYSEPFQFGPRATSAMSRTTAISRTTRTSSAVAVCSACCAGRTASSFFDVSSPRQPEFLFSTSAPQSSITDDFLPLENGGYLVTQMGSASGGAPGRLAEFDAGLHLVKEWPDNPPQDGFNPHGISARPEINLMGTSDFLLPASTLNL